MITETSELLNDNAIEKRGDLVKQSSSECGFEKSVQKKNTEI